MKFFKKFIVILIAINSLNVFAQSAEEKLLNDTLYLRSIPDIQDFINSIFNPSREDLRNKPGNTQSA